MFLEFFLLLAFALFVFYKWSISGFDYFEKRNLPFDKPFPLLGCQKDIVFRKAAMYDHINRIYKQFNTKVFGVFDQRTPVYTVRDPAIIKLVTVKDFDHFVNHPNKFSDDDLLGKSLAIMRNEQWKEMRSTLSPIFTGSKMRKLFTLINEVAFESMQFLKKDANCHEGIEINVKDFFTRFSNDVIASTAFGLKMNSFENENNEFYLMGKKITKFTAYQSLKFFLIANYKTLSKLLNIDLFDPKDINYFRRLVLDAMKYRQDHKIMRPDMINMLMEAKGIYINQDEDHKPTATTRQWTDDELVAQCFLFFFSGFETTSTAMAFIAHELMQNSDIQERLRQEVNEVKESLDGKPLTYEALQGMKYMDMVVSETLRKWPIAVMTDRQCTKDFSYKDDEIEFTIKAGEKVWIPIVGIHLDEQYFPNPLKFDPERFSDENKGNIQPYTYLPFGVGPRNCIASRFALLELKAIIFHLLCEFQIEVSAKSSIPIVLDRFTLSMGAKNGFWMKFVELSNKA